MVSMAKRIGLIVDNPKRDLKGLVILATHLIKAGHEVHFIPMYFQHVDTFLGKVDLLVVNYVRLNNRAFLERCQAAGVPVYVLDTEGGILSTDGIDSPENWARHLGETGLGALVAGYFFWGAKTFEAFSAYSQIDKSDLFLTGCPRYDQCDRKWVGMLKPRYENHILVNANFSAINPKFGSSVESEKSAFKSVGWDGGYVDELYEHLLAIFPKFIDEVRFIAESMPTRKVVVRPHPFEDLKPYTAAFEKFENVIVDGDGDVFDAISQAACVVHLNCGTAVDSLIMKVPPISIEYLNDALMAKHTPIPSKVSYRALGRDDLIDAINHPGVKYAQLVEEGVVASYVEGFFYLCDGDAGERVASVIKQRAEVEETKSVARSGLFAGRDSVHQTVYKAVCMIFGSSFVNVARTKLSAKRKDKFIDVHSVRELFQLSGVDAAELNVAHVDGLLPFMSLTSIRARIRR
ncbi:MAG: surface carbohydrate biosynthesis protein [Candidatus Azotimanducaceae bacterium]|jgi:surface carbohydrate biosynthesis protein